MRVRVLLAALGILVAVLAPLWGPLALRPFAFFAVRRVEVVGARYLEPAALVGALGMRRDASVWDRLGPMEDRLRLVRGVAEVSVRRGLPGTILVMVREVDPVALAEGAEGLVALGADARPLPYDPVRVPVDAPVVVRSDTALLAALDAVRTADPTFYESVAQAGLGAAGEVRLEIEGGGTMRLALPVDAAMVRSLAAVERDLSSRSQAWRELDGRYGGWVVVRRPAKAEASS